MNFRGEDFSRGKTHETPMVAAAAASASISFSGGWIVSHRDEAYETPYNN